MSISIAMTTFNGMSYISELLESLLSQTKLPDEVIISDDCSFDGTYDFVKKFILERKLDNWHIFQNENNLGWRKNFRIALSKCSGDFIFLCDQDDVWFPTKIERMVSAMENNKKIELLVSNYVVRNDGDLYNPKIRTYPGNNKRIINVKKKSLVLDSLRPGCTFCLRKSLNEFVLSHDNQKYPHDAMIWAWASIKKSLYVFKSEEMLFRRHADSAASRKSVYDYQSRIEYVEDMISFTAFFYNLSVVERKSNTNIALLKSLAFMEKRLVKLKNASLFKLVLFAIFNIKKYPSFSNAVSDIVLLLKSKKAKMQ